MSPGTGVYPVRGYALEGVSHGHQGITIMPLPVELPGPLGATVESGRPPSPPRQLSACGLDLSSPAVSGNRLDAVSA